MLAQSALFQKAKALGYIQRVFFGRHVHDEALLGHRKMTGLFWGKGRENQW
jgi:hypothetical protein